MEVPLSSGRVESRIFNSIVRGVDAKTYVKGHEKKAFDDASRTEKCSTLSFVSIAQIFEATE